MRDEPIKENITALILAGGKGRRLGGADKGKVKFNGKCLIEHVIAAIKPQVATVIINANRHLDDYSLYGYQVISDNLAGFQGPLAGYASGLQAISTPYMVVVPCDGPWIYKDLVCRLAKTMASQNAEISVAHDGQRMQPVYCLLGRTLLPSLEEFLSQGGRKIDKWYTCHAVALADFSDIPNCFYNVNTRQDITELQKRATTA